MAIDVELLREFIHADPEKGTLTWSPRNRKHFDSDKVWKIWNSKNAYLPALNSLRQHGYRGGNVQRKFTYKHRAMWAIVTGEWPKQIDHISGNRDDNSMANLRDVPQSVNAKNMGRRRDSKGGVTGVNFCPINKNWVVRLSGKHVGSFACFARAVLVRRVAEFDNGFSPRHGR